MAFTFTKDERLSHKKLIALLFEKGNRSISRFPFRFTWVEAQHGGPFPVQVMFVVPKKNFKAAVSRNRIKRQMRELYRLQKHELYEKLDPLHKTFILSLSFQGKAALKYDDLKVVFAQIFNQLKHEMAKSGPAPVHRVDPGL